MLPMRHDDLGKSRGKKFIFVILTFKLLNELVSSIWEVLILKQAQKRKTKHV